MGVALNRDSSPVGSVTEFSITDPQSGWLFVQISSSCLCRALSHAKASNLKSVDCFLIGTSWINEGEQEILGKKCVGREGWGFLQLERLHWK